MAIISRKKIPFKISSNLRKYLKKYKRAVSVPIEYNDLLRYDNAIPLYDNKGKDTLWETVFYSQEEMKDIHLALKKIYSEIKSAGDVDVMKHLSVDRVDLCVYGNTKPFRIRIVNRVNDNFDYFYIKNADASRVYGLELEHLLSPNRINYVVHKDSLIEEHIVGIPGDKFITNHMKSRNLNKIRLAKEFVKFNERCFVSLLGDMHSSNFVVNVVPDFEEITYRIRSIDFDQQSYEGRKNIYLPQYFKQNNPLIQLGLKMLTPESVRQYQKEERSMIAHRLKIARKRVMDLMKTMMGDTISFPKNVESLKKDLAKYYDEPRFLNCRNMGEIVKISLWLVIIKPDSHA
ncbi:MAG: hypothetical protein ACJA2S_000851 [Cyclobacteriaceae bacterium]|jgi:hypothetical protein